MGAGRSREPVRERLARWEPWRRGTRAPAEGLGRRPTDPEDAFARGTATPTYSLYEGAKTGRWTGRKTLRSYEPFPSPWIVGMVVVVVVGLLWAIVTAP